MKPGKYYLVLAVFGSILFSLASAETESPQNDFMLINRHNPALAGIKEVSIAVAMAGTEPNQQGTLRKNIESMVISNLAEAGIKINRDGTGGTSDIPELKVEINTLKIEDCQKYVFHVQTSLSRLVRLEKQDRMLFKVDVWKTEPAMGVSSFQNMPEPIENTASEQIGVFVHSYIAANPQRTRQTSIDNEPNVSPIPQNEQTKPTTAEYKYIASKNSNVFHKAGCSMAARISPANLVFYNSRDEATNAGKRPCKRCNP